MLVCNRTDQVVAGASTSSMGTILFGQAETGPTGCVGVLRNYYTSEKQWEVLHDETFPLNLNRDNSAYQVKYVELNHHFAKPLMLKYVNTSGTPPSYSGQIYLLVYFDQVYTGGSGITSNLEWTVKFRSMA